MSVICTQENRTLTAALSGELDHHAAKTIMSQLELQVDAARPRALVLDLSQLTFTDSSGIYVERPDAKVCGINVARRYSHSAHEVVDVRDVAGCRDIVYTAIQKYI